MKCYTAKHPSSRPQSNSYIQQKNPISFNFSSITVNSKDVICSITIKFHTAELENTQHFSCSTQQQSSQLAQINLICNKEPNLRRNRDGDDAMANKRSNEQRLTHNVTHKQMHTT